MRKALVIVGIVLVVLILGAVALVSLVDVNQFRGRIEAELRKQTGRSVTLGPMGLRLLPLSIRVDDFSIGESPAFPTGRQFASAKELSVRVDLLPLLRKEIRVDSIRLAQPAVELVRNAAGKWNFSDLGGGAAKSGTGGSGGSGTGGSGTGLTLGELAVEDGTVAVSDLGNAKSRSVYDHIDATLRDFAPGKPFEITASVRLPGSAKGSVTVNAKGGPLGSDHPLTGRISIEQASLAEFQQFLSRGARGKVDGVLSGTTDFESLNSVAKAHGALDFTKLRVSGADLGYPVRVDYALDDNLDSGLLKVSSLTVRVGQVPIAMSGELNTKASTINAAVNINRAGLAEVLAAARAVGTEGVSGTGILSLNLRVQGPLEHTDQLNYSGGGSLQNASVKLPSLTKPVAISSANLKFDKNRATLDNLVCTLGGSTLRGNLTARNFSAPEVGFGLNVDKLDLAELQQITSPGSGNQPSSHAGGSGTSGAPIDAKGTVQIGAILYNGLTLKNVRADCKFNRNVLTLAPLTADLFGGKQSGSITLDMRSQPAALAVNAKLDGVDANQLLSATTSMKNRLYGLLAAQTDSTMKLAPGADMARTLNGTLKLDMTKGKLVGVNVLNELSSVGKFLGYSPRSEPETNILALGGDLKITNGVANTDNLTLRLNEGTVAAAGAVNLADESLNLRVTAVLDHATSQKAGGTNIGGFMSTALANNKGELVIPATVTGTFAHPRFLPDASRIAEMKLKNLLPTTTNPGSLTSGILGAVTGQKGGAQSLLDSLTGKPTAPASGGANPAPGAKPANGDNGVGGLLDALGSLGKKKDDKKPPAK
jgi:AsmA protein